MQTIIFFYFHQFWSWHFTNFKVQICYMLSCSTCNNAMVLSKILNKTFKVQNIIRYQCIHMQSNQPCLLKWKQIIIIFYYFRTLNQYSLFRLSQTMHSTSGEIQWKGIHSIFTSWHQQPTGIGTWVDNTLSVTSQRSNQLGQRVRPASKRFAGQLGCHSIDSHIKQLITAKLGYL